MVRPTCKKLRAFMKEERAASKEYRHYGFKGPSKDEARHSRFMKRKLKQWCK